MISLSNLIREQEAQEQLSNSNNQAELSDDFLEAIREIIYTFPKEIRLRPNVIQGCYLEMDENGQIVSYSWKLPLQYYSSEQSECEEKTAFVVLPVNMHFLTFIILDGSYPFEPVINIKKLKRWSLNQAQEEKCSHIDNYITQWIARKALEADLDEQLHKILGEPFRSISMVNASNVVITSVHKAYFLFFHTLKSRDFPPSSPVLVQ